MALFGGGRIPARAHSPMAADGAIRWWPNPCPCALTNGCRWRYSVVAESLPVRTHQWLLVTLFGGGPIPPRTHSLISADGAIRWWPNPCPCALPNGCRWRYSVVAESLPVRTHQW